METIGVMEVDNLSAGGYPDLRFTRNIPAGVAVKRGNILNAAYHPIVTGGVPFGIALNDIAATDTIRVCVISVTGEFNAYDLSTGDTKTPMEWWDDLRAKNIYVRQPAP